MNQTIVRKSKWFWPWEDEQEEAWLEEMSHQGLHLHKADILAQYDFVQDQPEDYIYRLDFQNSLKKKNKDAYLRLFADAGWEYLGEMGGWQYFRILSKPGETREIFTDPETKIDKYQRFLTWFVAIFPAYWVIIISLLSDNPHWLMWLVIVLSLTVSTLWAVVTIKVQQRIKQLKAL